MSHIFLNIGPEDMIGWIIWVIVSLVWWGQNRVKHSTPLLCFAEEIDFFHKICGLWNKETKCIHVFISENTILNIKNIGEGSAKDRTLSQYWKNYLPPSTKKDRIQTTYWKMSSSKREEVQIMSCWNSLIWHSSLNLNLLVVWRRSFYSFLQ